MELDTSWLTPAQAANRLGVSGQRIRQLLDAGRLKHVRTPLGRLVDPADVARQAAERAQKVQGGVNA